jgi:cytochrome c
MAQLRSLAVALYSPARVGHLSGTGSDETMGVIMLKYVFGAAVAVVLTSGAMAQDAAEGEKVFKKCMACHAVGDGAKNKVGPVLNGVVGRTAGTYEGFNFSQAMKDAGAAGLVWTEEELSKYLENPKELIKGNKMAFAGLKKEEERANVIAFLKTHPAAP